ncbi:MAG TPA: CAP domain-containing protein [Thermoanaerobaculia bacterium]|nr:CAP domain-containing protein [Thermoanaerobaculia bacterium]
MPFPRRLPRGTRLLVAFLLFAVPGLGCSGSSPSEPGGSGPSPASVEASAVARVNESRRGDGKGELLLDPMLSEMARAYSRRMRDEGFFGHVDPQGGGLVDRLRGAGIGFSIVGENLAQVGGVSDPAAVAHRMLMENAAHRANILDARFTEVVIGVAQRDDTYWMTQVFLRP